MAKFRFIEWLVTFLSSQDDFIFDWDEGNSTKNKEKHGVPIDEIESCFLDDRIIPLGIQYSPETQEERYGIIAKSETKRALFVCFTIRKGQIRPISAREANKQEQKIYEQ